MFLKRPALHFFLALVFLNCGPGEKPESLVHQFDGNTMGTTFSIKFGNDSRVNQLSIKELEAGITNLLLDLNQKMSTYIKDSELSRFNSTRETGWFPVSAETAFVIQKAINFSDLSGGAFDITVGPLVNLWGFGPQPRRQEPPDPKLVEQVRNQIGYKNLELRLNPPALRKKQPELYCDLSAIAKGFGVDQVSDYLENAGIDNYLVEIGGEVRTRGINPDKQLCWKIGISVPKARYGIQKAIFLDNSSMATSGDYRNYFEKDGVRYSHTIDPRTGNPVVNKLASVTVVYNTCTEADAYATAIAVLGQVNGLELARKEKLAVLLIIRQDKGFAEIMTPEFEKLLKVSQ